MRCQELSRKRDKPIGVHGHLSDVFIRDSQIELESSNQVEEKGFHPEYIIIKLFSTAQDLVETHTQ